MSKKYFVNPEIILSFSNGISLTLPDLHESFNIDTATLNLITAICDETGQKMEVLKQNFSEESLEEAQAILAEKKILLDEKPKLGIAQAWKDWGDATWFFHKMTTNIKFAISEQEQLEIAKEITEVPKPQRFKCLCNQCKISIKLPQARPISTDSFSQILLNRRTCRNFIDIDIKLAELSDILFYTGGLVFENDTVYFGQVSKKCAPSPGAIHGTEIYLAIRKCQNVEPGIYHYCVEHHTLNQISSQNPDSFIHSALLDQNYFESASVVFIFTCVAERFMWKYKTGRIYRLAHLEVGHYCQNLLLTGTALGLGVFSTGALNDELITLTLNLDPVKEFAMYAAGTGIESEGIPYYRPGVAMSTHLPEGASPKLPYAEGELPGN